MDFTRQIETNRRILINDILRRLEAALGPFRTALDTFLATLFQARLPADWRRQWHAFVATQATAGFAVEPHSIREMEQWIEAWARFCDLLPVEEVQAAESPEAGDDSHNVPSDPSQTHIQPAAGLRGVFEDPDYLRHHTHVPSAAQQPPAGNRRGDQSKFAAEAEELVSKKTGVPRNTGLNRQRIPGSGPGGYRILDLQLRGPDGSVRRFGAVVEIKASTGKKFGDLSKRSRDQILDAVKYVQTLQSKASLVKDPILKARLKAAHIKVYSDLPKPKRGKFAKLIKRKLIEWESIPRPKPAVGTGARAVRPVVRSSPQSVGKPGLGAARNLALGVIASLAEAGVAESAYHDTARMLDDLLSQIAKNDDADEAEWEAIRDKLDEIANMKQSWLGAAWEFISFGQRSVVEKQAVAMAQLAWDLGKKFGYNNERTWGEVFRGQFGRFKKEVKEE